MRISSGPPEISGGKVSKDSFEWTDHCLPRLFQPWGRNYDLCPTPQEAELYSPVVPSSGPGIPSLELASHLNQAPSPGWAQTSTD